MWFVKLPESQHFYSNDPNDSIGAFIAKKHPGALLFRSLEPCLQEFSELINAAEVVPGEPEETTIETEDGPQVVTVPGPSRWEPVGNTYALEEGPVVVVRSPGGEVLLTVLLEQVQA